MKAESPGLPELSDEAKVADLLPPSVEEWDPPSKKIAERRIAGWRTSFRLFERRSWRPCGNSRKFWKKVEEDDPFLPADDTKRVAQEGHAVYAADRLVRMPDAPRSQHPTEHAPPPPQPKRVAPPPRDDDAVRPPPQRPEPTWTREPNPAPAPRPVQREPDPEPRKQGLWDGPASAPIDRTPPRFAPPNATSTGRIPVGPNRAPQAAPQQTRFVDSDGRSASEVRAEREAAKAASKGPPPPPKLRGIDEVLAILGDLKMSEELHRAGITGTTSADRVEPPPTPKVVRTQTPPRPPPRQEAPPPRAQPPRPAAPAPSDDDEGFDDDEPPRSLPPVAKPPAVNRSPSGAGAAGGGLDDLFGGGPVEGRVRIPKRTSKTTKPDGE